LVNPTELLNKMIKITTASSSTSFDYKSRQAFIVQLQHN
jgi:hypothetical protein